MYMHVKLLNGFKESLTYKVPPTWSTEDLIGMIIEVPLQKRTEAAFVEELFNTLDASATYTIRDAHSREIVPSDPHYMNFIHKLSDYYALDKLSLLKKIRHFMQEKEYDKPMIEPKELANYQAATLTAEQQAVADPLMRALDANAYYPTLLHGVTGSGKTEIYKKLIIHAWSQGKSSLFLVPEVSLAVQFTHILKNTLPADMIVLSFHSATSITEKKALWQHLLSNRQAIIVGVHLPILLPIPHLGLIIVDEEHEVGFQSQKHPKINTKEAALLRAQVSSLPLIAGSATPSIASLYNVQHRGWHFFELKNRFSGAFPSVEVVKLTDNRARKHFWVSKELEAAIHQQLLRKEQTIIFLNRRGYSFFIQCKSCGFIPHCAHCSVSLTLHNTNRLICHYCTYKAEIPATCGTCKSSSFLQKGIGTQQVVTLLEKLFPQARITRADLDTTVNKKKWRQTMKDFEEGALDILVGTQTITKGYHFPRVTLVGILWADINLSLPIYNAAEVSLQQLIQVSGRAGRQSAESHVIVQTMIDHPIFNFLHEQSYTRFYQHEIENRHLVHYPPCIRFAEIELKHKEESIVAQEADLFAQAFKLSSENTSKKILLLGPSQPPVHRIKNVFSRKMYIKAKLMKDIIDTYKSIDKSDYKSGIFFTPNPLS